MVDHFISFNTPLRSACRPAKNNFLRTELALRAGRAGRSVGQGKAGFVRKGGRVGTGAEAKTAGIVRRQLEPRCQLRSTWMHVRSNGARTCGSTSTMSASTPFRTGPCMHIEKMQRLKQHTFRGVLALLLDVHQPTIWTPYPYSPRVPTSFLFCWSIVAVYPAGRIYLPAKTSSMCSLYEWRIWCG